MSEGQLTAGNTTQGSGEPFVMRHGGNAIVLPSTDPQGRPLTGIQAYAQYLRTGKHLGIYDSLGNARAAVARHRRQRKPLKPSTGEAADTSWAAPGTPGGALAGEGGSAGGAGPQGALAAPGAPPALRSGGGKRGSEGGGRSSAPPAKAYGHGPGDAATEQMIREEALKRGMDPDYAIRVYRGEGAGGYVGDHGTSFGPFQLHRGGPGSVGYEFEKDTGLNLEDRSTTRAQIQYALNWANKRGWAAWHGRPGGREGPTRVGLSGDGRSGPVSGGGEPSPASGEGHADQPMGNPSAVIIHHTAGDTRGGARDTLAQRGLSVQYIVDRDGTIYWQGPHSGEAHHMLPGWGPKGHGLRNSNTIGFEVVARNDQDVTPAQIAAVREFVEKRWPGVPVYGHGEVNPGHKQRTEGLTIADAIREDEKAGRIYNRAPAAPTPDRAPFVGPLDPHRAPRSDLVTGKTGEKRTNGLDTGKRDTEAEMYFPADQHGHRNVIRRYIVYQIDDTGPQQKIWGQGLYQEEVKWAYRHQDFGVSTVPPLQSEGYVYSLAARPDQMYFGQTEHPDYRPTNKKPGESFLYDANGNIISLHKDSNGGVNELKVESKEGKETLTSKNDMTVVSTNANTTVSANGTTTVEGAGGVVINASEGGGGGQQQRHAAAMGSGAGAGILSIIANTEQTGAINASQTISSEIGMSAPNIAALEAAVTDLLARVAALEGG